MATNPALTAFMLSITSVAFVNELAARDERIRALERENEALRKLFRLQREYRKVDGRPPTLTEAYYRARRLQWAAQERARQATGYNQETRLRAYAVLGDGIERAE